MDFGTLAVKAAQGAVAGLILASARYGAKHNQGEGESFQVMKAVPTIVVGAFIGAIAGITGQEYSVIADGSMTIGLTYLVQNLFKMFARTWGNKLDEYE